MTLSKSSRRPVAEDYQPASPRELRAYAARLQRGTKGLSAADALRQAEADEKRRANAYAALSCDDANTTGGAR